VIQGQTTVQVNVLALPGWQDVQMRVLQALAKHPEARADVLQALAPILDANDSEPTDDEPSGE
jgi:hypothetical protein